MNLAARSDQRRVVRAQLANRYCVRSSDPELWRISDWTHSDMRRREPFTAGILDLSGYENH